MSVQKMEIEITIDVEGNVSYEVKGLKGKNCTKATQFLDEALGEVVERKFTREYYEQPVKTSTRISTKL
jgi:hypothetical protein